MDSDLLHSSESEEVDAWTCSQLNEVIDSDMAVVPIKLEETGKLMLVTLAFNEEIEIVLYS